MQEVASTTGPTRWRLGVAVVLATLTAAACNGQTFEFGGVVEIEPDQSTWMGSAPYEAQADVTQADGEAVPDDYVVTAEVLWAAPPGQTQKKQTFTASRVGSETFRIIGVDAHPAQLVTVRWLVESASGTLLAEAEPFELQVDCPDGPEPYLEAMQEDVKALVGELDSLAEEKLNDIGYQLNNHGWAQIPGIGVSFIPSNLGAVLDGQVGLDLDEPPLLLFTSPGPGDITDTEPEFSLELAGWGYAAPYVGERPRMGCLPYRDWAVHEAGWHTPHNGSMILDDGTQEATAAAIQLGVLANYHPRLWDVHVWLEDGSDVPSLSLLNVDDEGDLIPVTGGASSPDGIFFFPPMPEPAQW